VLPAAPPLAQIQLDRIAPFHFDNTLEPTTTTTCPIRPSSPRPLAGRRRRLIAEEITPLVGAPTAPRCPSDVFVDGDCPAHDPASAS
jgi:hypothetical protein